MQYSCTSWRRSTAEVVRNHESGNASGVASRHVPVAATSTGPAPRASRWRGVPTNPKRGGRRDVVVSTARDRPVQDGGFEEEAKATEDARDRVTDRGGPPRQVLEGPSGRPEARGASRGLSARRRTAREDVRGRPNDPQLRLCRESRWTGFPIGLSVPRCLHRACPTDLEGQPTSGKSSGSRRASDATGQSILQLEPLKGRPPDRKSVV